MKEFLETRYYHNTVQDYLIALSIIVFGLILAKLFRNLILRRLERWAEKTETLLDDYFLKATGTILLPIINLGIIYWSLNYLTLTEKVKQAIHVAATVVITFYIIRLITSIIKIALETYLQRQAGGMEKMKQLKGVMIVLNLMVWILGSVALLNNLGYNVTTIITGLGIGGIAIALAAQNILGDVFNYFVIFFDRPFEIGDQIAIDDKRGTVEYIGIKTTRLKSLTGELLVFSNSDLTKSRLHNFQRMERRRVVFTLGLSYNTPIERLKKAPKLIQAVIESQPKTTFDRAHFLSYGQFSLNYEVVYFVESGDYNTYMDIHQDINLGIFEGFKKEGITFALPTQQVFLKNETTLDSPQ